MYTMSVPMFSCKTTHNWRFLVYSYTSPSPLLGSYTFHFFPIHRLAVIPPSLFTACVPNCYMIYVRLETTELILQFHYQNIETFQNKQISQNYTVAVLFWDSLTKQKTHTKMADTAKWLIDSVYHCLVARITFVNRQLKSPFNTIYALQ